MSSLTQKIGIGLRHCHFNDVLAELPDVGWLEVHSENFFCDGGAPHFYLKKISKHYPLSFHGVGLSIGSADINITDHLEKLKKLISLYDPFLVSDHLSWSQFGNTYYNDLLPIAYTQESLKLVIDHVHQIQDVLKRQFLIENPSSYISFTNTEMEEWDFLNTLVEKTGCGLLLDVNNIYVSTHNLGGSPYQYLDHIKPEYIKEIHLAGPNARVIEGREVLVDTHSKPVLDEVWLLYEYALKKIGIPPTLIEWDEEIPELKILLGEAQKAKNIIKKVSHERYVA